MDKIQRLKLIKEKFEELKESECDAVLPISSMDIEEEINEISSYKYYRKSINSNYINSDEY